MQSGPCTVTTDGRCFRSPNYPFHYDANSECSIVVNRPLLLHATDFLLQDADDTLKINTILYTSRYAPQGDYVEAQSIIAFHSDRWDDNDESAFEICGTIPPGMCSPALLLMHS